MDDEKSDNQLMKMLSLNDDQIAFERLYFKYKNALVRFSYGYTFNQDRAEEMMQETFLKMYRARAQFDGSRPFRTWLWTICKNTNLDNLQKNKRENLIYNEEAILQIADDIDDTLDILIQEASREQLEGVIKTLPLAQREALLLWMNDDLSFEEMGEVLQKTSQAVKNLVHRAKETLRKNL